MHSSLRFLLAVFGLFFFSWRAYAQAPPTTPARPTLPRHQLYDSAILKIFPQVINRRQMQKAVRAESKSVAATAPAGPKNGRLKNIAAPGSDKTLAAPNCVDTSGHILTTESNTNIGTDNNITRTRDGNILVPGFRYSITLPYFTFPYLIKYSPEGNIVWSKSFDGLGIYPQNSAYAYRCFELNDGSLLMAGAVDIPKPYNGTEELILWKLDAAGNVVWVQTDSCSLWYQNSGSVYVTGMTQDPAGNIYLCGDQLAFGAIPSHSFVLKMDATGNIIWDKNFTYGGSKCFGMFLTSGNLSVIGTHSYTAVPVNGVGYSTSLWNLRINPATGDTLSSKSWYPDYGNNSMENSFAGSGSIQQLTNGNIAVSGTAAADLGIQTGPITHGVVAEFDPSFNFVRGWMIRSTMQTNYYNTVISTHASGRISYTYLTLLSTGYDEDVLYGAIEQGQIIKERIFHERNRSSAASTNFLNITGNQDVVIQTYGDPLTNTGGDELVRLHDSDTSSVCTGNDSSVSWIEPYLMAPDPYFRCDSIASNVFTKTNRTIPLPVPGNPLQQTACKLTAFCDSVKLSVNQLTFCAGQPAIFTCYRNPECGSRPTWTFDTTNLQSYVIPNDSTLKITYRDQYDGPVSVSMNGTCRNLSDAKTIKVLPAEKPVSLGPDAYLCPDSSLVLRPAKGYDNYLWADGSVADTLQVGLPGKYYVTVTNSCGVPMSDTVLVQKAPFLNFSVGVDAAFCINDPVVLQAPDNYTNYSWRANNNANTYSSQSVTLYPIISTTYFASAQTTQGCVVRDTILVTIHIPGSIYLGADTSFCYGDSILLNAGPGFLNYTWNNGETAYAIYISSEGKYSVKAQSPNGCYGMDTLTVEKVYPLPSVRLDQQNWLCAGTPRMLDAGPGYIKYLWQDGSNLPDLSVNNTGTYWVNVEDLHGCSAGDTVVISQAIAKPTGFLIADTVVCDGYPSKIQSTGQFSAYSWDTGEKENAITVRGAGNYSLTVSDVHGCSATATVAVSTKQCLFGIYFPNAFSPDKNGINDVFHPLVFGHLSKYQFQIFNRWGQLVFESEDYNKGWNGLIGDMQQSMGTFVWICHYQFVGETEKRESGSVVLIR